MVGTETSAGVTHQYKYDLNNNRTNAVYGVTGRSVEWEYDALNRIEEIHDEQGYVGTITVSGGGTNLQAAIDGADAGSLILVADGTYDPITIDKPVTVQSENGSQASSIQASGASRCASLSNNARLIGFELSGGVVGGTTDGAGAFVDTGCLISDCVISNNQTALCSDAAVPSGKGGGLYLRGTALRCTIVGNTAWNGAGAFLEDGASMADCTVVSNTASGVNSYGGGLYLQDGATAVNCVVGNNTATDGGGLFFYNPGGKVNSSTIASNLGVSAVFPDTGGGGIGTRRSEFKDHRSIGELSHSVIWGNTPVATSEDWTGTGNVYANPASVTSASGADLSISTASTNSTSLTTLYKYDLNSNPRLRSLPNGTSEERSFDALNRLQSFSMSSLSSLGSFAATYKHDPVGNLRQMSDTVSGLHTIPQSVVYDWSYDDAYRLESESVSENSTPLYETQFDWDDAGNRTAMRKYSGGSLVSTTTYDPASDLNQMTSWTCGQTNAVYSYDLNGARTGKTITASTAPASTETTAYSYDEDNRLIGVAVINNAGKTNSWAFGYDYRTRRISRETPTEKTLHVFDGGLNVQEYDVSETSIPSASNLSTESIRGEGMGGGVGGMVYSIRNGQLKASHSNHRGDVVAKTDSLGNLSWFARYNAYGTRFHEIGATFDRQRGNTKDEEELLKIRNQGMRWDDIVHGVWLTPDPIGYADGPNRYCLMHNNPISSIDPSGLDTLLLIWATKEGDYGHTAVAVSDYKQAEGSSDMINTGTYTLMDLSPGVNMGVHNAGKDVKASYKSQSGYGLKQLKESGGGAHGKGVPPDAIIRFKTAHTTDQKVRDSLEAHKAANPYFNGKKNNCSDFGKSAAETASDNTVDGTEPIRGKPSTTPNQLYKDAKDLPNATVVKDPEGKTDPNFADALFPDSPVTQKILEKGNSDYKAPVVEEEESE